MRDENIIELYKKRNEAALDETDRKYGAYLYRVADNILRNNEDSEEAVNETYYKAWESIPPKEPKLLRIYLAKITRNIAFNMYSANRAAKRGGGEIDAVLEELSECVPDRYSVEEDVIGRELSEAVRDFVRELPEREGYIFIRRYFYAESVAEIAIKYGMRRNTVSVTLNRSREKLREYLSKEGFLI